MKKAPKPKPLDDAEKVAILEAIARDENAKPYERLQAIAQLDRRRKPARGSKLEPAEVEDGQPPDPMADLDELAGRRRRRAS